MAADGSREGGFRRYVMAQDVGGFPSAGIEILRAAGRLA
jgi:hypothetical protein